MLRDVLDEMMLCICSSETQTWCDDIMQQYECGCLHNFRKGLLLRGKRPDFVPLCLRKKLLWRCIAVHYGVVSETIVTQKGIGVSWECI
jgi:hypothetical protein